MSMTQNAAAGPSALALVVTLSAQLLVVLDLSIVHVALPSIQADLGFSAGGTQWVVTAYAIAFGGLLMVGGRAGDALGHRRLFLTGLTEIPANQAHLPSTGLPLSRFAALQRLPRCGGARAQKD